MKKSLFLLLLPCSIIASAQEETANSKIQHSHLLELSCNTGYSFSNTLKGNAYEPRAYTWKIKDNIFYRANLGCYVGKRVEVGAGFNIYKWNGHIEYVIPRNYLKDATATALSSYVFSNYYFPIGTGAFYVGLIFGVAKSFVSGTQYVVGYTGNYTGFYSGHGFEYNEHIGYKFPLVKCRLWLNVEGGATQTEISSIDLSYLHRSHSTYTMANYSALTGLMFRM